MGKRWRGFCTTRNILQRRGEGAWYRDEKQIALCFPDRALFSFVENGEWLFCSSAAVPAPSRQAAATTATAHSQKCRCASKTRAVLWFNG
jgi:hypothetical protein